MRSGGHVLSAPAALHQSQVRRPARRLPAKHHHLPHRDGAQSQVRLLLPHAARQPRAGVQAGDRRDQQGPHQDGSVARRPARLRDLLLPGGVPQRDLESRRGVYEQALHKRVAVHVRVSLNQTVT